LSRQRKKEYIGNLEKRLDEVSHEKVEVQGRLTTAMSENRDAKSTIASLSSQITSLQDENTRLRGQVSAAAADAAMKETIRLTTAAEHAKALREASLGFANALAPTTTSTTATEETPPPSAPEPPAATPSEESNPNT
jgi:chromosome segregation ATPase